MTAEDDKLDKLLGDLYRQGDDVQPPPHLDAAIRAAARREVQSKPEKKPHPLSPFGHNWKMTLPLVAVLVLGVSVIVLMESEKPGLMQGKDTYSLSAPIKQDATGKAETAPLVGSVTRPDAEEATVTAGASQSPAPAAAPLAEQDAMEKQIPEKLAAPAEDIAGRAEDPREAARVGEVKAKQRVMEAERQVMETAKPAAPITAEGAADSRTETTTADAAAPIEPASEPATTGMAGLVMGATAARKKEQAPVDAYSSATVMADKEATADRAVPLAGEPAYNFKTPEAWLKAIDKLLDEKKMDEANKSLEAFVKAYPDYQLDEKYRALLPSE